MKGESDRMYKVIDVFPIGDNSSVTIEGKCENLQNNMTIHDENNKEFKLLNIAMVGGQKADDIGKTTILLIEGKFDSKFIKL